ncbi:MAG: tetratricopeptide repeat protein [Promethearchaeota archaeon]
MKNIKDEAERKAVEKIKKEFKLKDKHFIVNEDGHISKVVSERPEPHYKLANILRIQKLYNEAIEEYKETLRIEPRYFEASTNLGITYLKKGLFNDAIQEFKRAVELAPDYYMAHYNLALSYDKNQEIFKALEHYRKAFRLRPYFSDALYNYGYLSMELGISKIIIQTFEMYIKFSQQKDEEEIKKIKSLIEELREKLGEENFRLNRVILNTKFKKLEQDSKDYIKLNKLGKVYLYLGDFKSAAECFVNATDIEPNNKDAWVNLGFTAELTSELTKSFKEIYTFYGKALQIDPNDNFLRIMLAISYFRFKKTDEAIKQIEIVLENNRNNSFALYNLGNFYFSLKDYETARDCYEEALEISPWYISAWKRLGDLLFESEEYKEAIKYYHKVLNIDPRDSEVYTNLSFSYFLDKDFELSFRMLVMALTTNPFNKKAWLMLEKFYRFYGEERKAALWSKIMDSNDPKKIINFIKNLHNDFKLFLK